MITVLRKISKEDSHGAGSQVPFWTVVKEQTWQLGCDRDVTPLSCTADATGVVAFSACVHTPNYDRLELTPLHPTLTVRQPRHPNTIEVLCRSTDPFLLNLTTGYLGPYHPIY